MDFTNLPPDSKAFLAPMAGVADRAFREICRDFGAAYTVTEMVSAKALCYGDKKTASLLALGAGAHWGLQSLMDFFQLMVSQIPEVVG